MTCNFFKGVGKLLSNSVLRWTIAYTHTRNRVAFKRWHSCWAMSWMNRHLHVQFNKLAALVWLVLLELIKIFLFLLVVTALCTVYRSWRWICNTVYQLYGSDGHFNHAIQLENLTLARLTSLEPNWEKKLHEYRHFLLVLTWEKELKKFIMQSCSIKLIFQVSSSSLN